MFYSRKRAIILNCEHVQDVQTTLSHCVRVNRCQFNVYCKAIESEENNIFIYFCIHNGLYIPEFLFRPTTKGRN